MYNVKKFKVLEPPEEAEEPVVTKKRNIVGMSAIISLIFGIFLAFIIEYFKKTNMKL